MRPSHIEHFFAEFSHILGICPCCGELFRLPEARPFMKHKPMRSLLDDIEDEERRLSRIEERLDEQEDHIRRRSAELGQRQAKRHLRKIDRRFSGSGLDPQDVKVLFDPVEYVVFDGMTKGSIKRIAFLAHSPVNRYDEELLRSVDAAVTKGNVEFKTLRVLDDGKIRVE